MNEINFKAGYGNEIRDVVLSKPSGGGYLYHIYINRFYYGIITLRQCNWVVLPQNPETFTTDDMNVLSDIVAEHENKKAPHF